jgi:hypothetical protein
MAFTAEEQRSYRLYKKAIGDPLPRGSEKPWYRKEESRSFRCKQKYKYRERVYIGIDTEGETRDNRHYTTMIAYSDKTGNISDILRANPGEHLSSLELLQFIVNIPRNCTAFAYSFGYDISKIIQDLPDRLIYMLLRPHLRKPYPKAFMGRQPIKWKGYRINLDNLRFSVGVWPEGGKKMSVGVWDLIRFCQCPFVAREKGQRGALEMWNIGTEEERDIIRKMKEKRSKFTQEELDEIENYTVLECRKMAELAEAIITAHEELATPSVPFGLALRRFDGPGSTVTALFREWNVVDYFKEVKHLYSEYPLDLQFAIKCAYFGGRFEHSIIGDVEEAWNKDINSAYPYQICQLPCIAHGKWRKTKNEIHARNSTLAIVHYELFSSTTNCRFWGPLPLRLEDGCICYPNSSGGGWVYRSEFFTALDSGLWPGLKFREAWIFERTCDCPNPLRHLAELYVERDRAGGTTGVGILLKLGPNSCYGKVAQSVGEAPFQCWVYAGMITSGCRAQGLEALVAHREPSNLIAIATDGILSLENVELKLPEKTGGENCKKPLGGWDSGKVGNLFLIRPGMVIGSKLKSRGIAEKTLRASADAIIKNWHKYHDASRVVHAPNESRFIGARQGVYFVPGSNEYRRRDEYGNWYTRSQQISFDPLPKREKALKDGRLTLRDMSEIVSRPYVKGALDKELEKYSPKEMLELEELDQPDGYEEMVYQ